MSAHPVQVRGMVIPAVLGSVLGVAALLPAAAAPRLAGGDQVKIAAAATPRADGPAVRLALRWRETAGGRRDLVATVTSSYAGLAEARLQARREGLGWRAIKAITLEGGRRSTRVPVSTEWFAPGVTLHVKLVGSGDRPTVWGADTVPRLAPLSLDLGDPRGLRSDWLARWAPVRIEVPADQEVTLASGWPFSVRRIRGPGGQPVSVSSPTPTVHRFWSTTAGRYVVKVGPEDLNGLYASTPEIVDLPREQLVDLRPEVSGQRVVGRFNGIEGEAVSLTQAYEQASLLGPDGEQVAPWLEHWTTGPIYRLPADGNYTLHYDHDTQVAVWSVPVHSLTVDGDTVDLAERASGDDAAVLRIDNPGQLPWHIRGTCLDTPVATSVLFPPSGSPTIDWRVGRPQAGTYYVVFGGRGGIGGGPVRASSGQAIDLGVDSGPVSLAADSPGCTWFRGSFHAEAGDVVSLWPEGDGPTELELLGPDGVVPDAGLAETWIIPEAGVYTWNTLEWEGWSTALRLQRWVQDQVPANGTPTVIVLSDDPVWRARAMRINATPGSTVTLTVEPPDRPGYWWALLRDGSGANLADPLRPEAPSRTFVAPASGAYMLWQDALGPGIVTVTATTQP